VSVHSPNGLTVQVKYFLSFRLVFCRATLRIARPMLWHGACPSVTFVGYIVWKWLNVFKLFHLLVAQSFLLFRTKCYGEIRTGSSLTEASNAGASGFSSNISLYFGNDTRERYSDNGILIGTYTCPTRRRIFEWSCVTLTDLARFATTRSAARRLCDSWASC